MNNFEKFLNRKLNEDAPPAPTTAPSAAPGAVPDMGMGASPPMGGGMGMGGLGMGGMGGGMGMGMGGAPMGGSPQTAPQKLKAYNVWDVLEQILEDE